MTFEDFMISLQKSAPASKMSTPLQALCYEKNGDWSKAHSLVDPSSDKRDKQIHAYLHRREGDDWNANYWYERAGETFPNNSLEQEWEKLVKDNLSN